MIALTNLHNPSSVLVDEATLRKIGELARSVGARVLVDEVYLEAMFENAPKSSVHLGPEFIATSSLTKGYGLSGLRCGWILAAPDLAERMRRLNDIFGAVGPYPAERLSVVALTQLPKIAARAKKILESNRATLHQFFDARNDLEVVRTDSGTTSFPRLRSGNVDTLCALLLEKYETAVAPGRFFESPQHFRIGMCCEPETFTTGMERLGRALDQLRLAENVERSLRRLQTPPLGADLIKNAAQLVEIHRLDQMEIESGFPTPPNIIVSAKAGQSNALERLPLLRPRDHFVAAAIGQPDIAQNHIELLRLHDFQSALNRLGGRNFVPEVLSKRSRVRRVSP